MATTPLTQRDYTTKYTPSWCPGCGNFGIMPATKGAFAELGIPPHQIAMIFGIGCSSNGSNFYNVYAFHGIHGRSLPVASGVKLANSELTVVADSGDGDAYGEGISHFVHTARTNIDITYLVHDNHLYSLTTGQTSPTSEEGMKTKSAPFGNIDHPFNPIATAILNGATFVAQGFSSDIPQLKELIKQAIKHRGFSFINIMQLCPTFNKLNEFPWYKERVIKLEDEKHNTSDYQAALMQAVRTDGKIPLGVFYQIEKPTYHDRLEQLKTPLVKHRIDRIDITRSLEIYR
ncbi:MAG: 2-oxoacid:ferredoxin oxidoreductase subunit beta [Candidatus Kerfeldbacteria bacterium]|nr:2-oxoacid:ferredoxin oxidoreductase subunit beta [Candidatus Kerfeldbacteria bacterium]